MGIRSRLPMLPEDGKGAGLLSHCAHAFLVVTPDVAVVESFRAEIAPVQRLTGADVFAKAFDQAAQGAAVTEPSPPATPVRFVREDTPSAVIVDEPDFAPLIHLHAGVTIRDLIEEESPAVGANDSDCLVDVLDAFALHPHAVFRIAAAPILRFWLVIGGADHAGQQLGPGVGVVWQANPKLLGVVLNLTGKPFHQVSRNRDV